MTDQKTTVAIAKQIRNLVKIEATIAGVTMSDFIEYLVLDFIDKKYPILENEGD